jgi:hypothetical protein
MDTAAHNRLAARTVPFPVLRWVVLLCFLVWFSTYAQVWGWANFLHVCDVAVILTVAGLWWGNAPLLSSQALNAILANALWCLDVGWRVLLGRHFVGGTEYMWDTGVPLWIRLFSLYHLVLPPVLVWSLWRVGYDRRGFPLQAGILAVVLAISRFFGAELNLNFAFVEPIFHRTWGPAPLHLFLVWLWMLIFLYWPVDWALRRFLIRKGAT